MQLGGGIIRRWKLLQAVSSPEIRSAVIHLKAPRAPPNPPGRCWAARLECLQNMIWLFSCFCSSCDLLVFIHQSTVRDQNGIEDAAVKLSASRFLLLATNVPIQERTEVSTEERRKASLLLRVRGQLDHRLSEEDWSALNRQNSHKWEK